LLARLPDDQNRYREMLAPTWQPTDGDLSNGSVWGCLAQAVWAVHGASSFEDAVVRAIDLGGDTDTVAAVAGGLAGAIHGIQRIPSRWTTYLQGTVNTPNGMQRYHLADLQHLTLRIIGEEVWPEAYLDRPVGPTEIAPGLHAANLAGAASVPKYWAVLSLCRVGHRFREHPVRRELYIADNGGGHNAALGAVVNDAFDSIDAFLAEGRNVVVHCHAGASRTGLVLRAWLMRTERLSEAEATARVAERWPLLDPVTNGSFTKFLRNDWLDDSPVEVS